MANYKEEISKERAELKEAFDSAEDGKYSAEAKKKSKVLTLNLLSYLLTLKI